MIMQKLNYQRNKATQKSNFTDERKYPPNFTPFLLNYFKLEKTNMLNWTWFKNHITFAHSFILLYLYYNFVYYLKIIFCERAFFYLINTNTDFDLFNVGSIFLFFECCTRYSSRLLGTVSLHTHRSSYF